MPIWAGLDDPVIDVVGDPQPAGRDGRARHRPRSRRGRARHAEAGRRRRRSPATSPARSRSAPTIPRAARPSTGGSIRGVRNGPSPDWLQQRLKAVGQRPISALVDMTNYIMLSYGRPLHVYDLARLEGAIVARRARDGEEVLALNGKTYTLDPTMTVIADDKEVHDIGGIMGGEHSGVTEATTDIVIECAYFTPEHIALTGQKLGLVSDARSRFERGVDPAFLEDGPAARHRDGDRAGRRRAFADGARRDAARARQGRRLRSGALRGARPASPCPRTGSRRYPAAARLRRDRADAPGGSRCRHGVATWTAPPTSSRRWSGSRGSTRCPRRRCRARRAWRKPTATRRAADRAQGAAHRGGARAQRGGDLELHLREPRRRRSAARPGSSPTRSARR